jgi:hypothetical protein
MAEEWFYTNDGQQMGPVSIAALRDLAAQGSLQPADLVWTEGMSTWVPANAARGLFPSTSLATSPVIPDVKPAQHQRYPEPRPGGRLRERRLDRPLPPAGMNTGSKILIVLGIVGVLGLMFMVAMAVVLTAITEAQQGPQPIFRTGKVAPPPPGMPQQGFDPNQPIAAVPPPPKEKLKTIPPGVKSYVVKLNEANLTDGSLVYFTKGKQVTIRVTATEWLDDQFGLVDVDLYVYDSTGALVMFDDGPQRDCLQSFVPQRSENYTVVVHLCTGASATCKVEY